MPRTKGAQPIDANAGARRNMALKLRIQGLTQAEIAARVGVSQSRISRMIKQALSEQQAEQVDELRAVEFARMESLHGAMDKQAQQGNPAAASVVVRASERRSKLMGLDLAKDGEGGGLRHDYFALVTIATTEEADDVFTEMAAAVEHNRPYMQAERVVDSTVDLGPTVTTMEQAKDAALAVVNASMPQPPLRMRVIILARSYSPVYP